MVLPGGRAGGGPSPKGRTYERFTMQRYQPLAMAVLMKRARQRSSTWALLNRRLSIDPPSSRPTWDT